MKQTRTVTITKEVDIEEVTCDGAICNPTNVTNIGMHEQMPAEWGILHVRKNSNTAPGVLNLDVTHLCPICLGAAHRRGPVRP